MIVYIYERLSQGVNAFRNPGPGTSINPTYYVSNGYLIFMPDIVYTIGYPGQSALKCVLPGIQAVVDKGYVDENAIGIQGHSWGGYQIAYMVTQTNRFKAAAPGAIVSNMTALTAAFAGARVFRASFNTNTRSRASAAACGNTRCATWRTRRSFARIACRRHL